MNKDQVIGIGLLTISIAVIAVYGYFIFLPPNFLVFGMSLDLFIMKLTLFIAVLVVFAILAWIGYTLATTPPPKPIEEIEKELEEELKEVEKEEARKEEETKENI